MAGRPLSRWLEAEAGPDPAELAERVAWWRAREAALAAHAPALLTTPPRERPAGAAERLETFLAVDVLRDELFGVLRRWFGAELTRRQVDLQGSLLGRARSVFDVRAWLPGGAELLPSDLLERAGTADGAHALLFALFDSRRCGAGVGRYPEQLAAITAHAPRGDLRVWDAGCGTGEGSREVGAALAEGRTVTVLGTTPWPLERLMAERGARPHEPEAEAPEVPPGVELRFDEHDLRRDGPPGRFDVVLCHGVLGESLSDAAIDAALATLRAATAPGGLLSITDRFREDVAAQARARTMAALSYWDRPAPGLYRAPA